MGLICEHPNGHVHYESGEDEFGEWEQHWCDVCHCYLTVADVQEFHERPDFQYADEK